MKIAIAAVLLVAASNVWAAPCAGFTDVEDTSPFCASVEWIKNRRITQGCTATEYCPNAPLTRLQMAAFMARFGTSSAAMYWVDESGAFVGRLGPEMTLETTIGGKRVLLAMRGSLPTGGRVPGPYGELYYEEPNCTGRALFPGATGAGRVFNAGAETFVAGIWNPVTSDYTYYVSGELVSPPITVLSRRFDGGGCGTENLVVTRAELREALGPYLVDIPQPLFLK